jgi:Fe-S cluster biogenesis protein NfuA
MNRKQLEQLRECVKAQMRWAVLHGGDQELLDLLRFESDRLLAMIGQCPCQASTAA